MYLLNKIIHSRYIGGEHARSGLLSFAIIMAGSVLQFVMFSLSARVLGPHDFGFFAFVFNVTSFLSVAGVLGQEKLITRLWSEYSGNGRADEALEALAFTAWNAAGGAVVISAGVALVGWLLGYPVEILVAAAALTGVQVILTFISHAARPIAGLAAGAGLFEITWRVLTIIGLLAVYFTQTDIDTPELTSLLAASMAVSIMLQLALMRHAVSFRALLRTAAKGNAEWWQRSAKMWASAILEAATQFADVIIIGLVFDFVSAGAYFAATRIASALHRVSLGAYNLAGTRISLLYYHRSRAELRAFIQSLSTQTTALALAGFVGLVIVGKPLLAVFGADYVSEYWTLLIVASGALVTAVFCIAPQMLLQTGHEGIYLSVLAVGLVSRLALLAVLIQEFGTIGAAIAVVIVNIATSITLNAYCRKRVGVDASIFASIWPVREQLDRRGPASRPRIILLQTQAEFAGAQEISRGIGDSLETKGYDVHHAFVYRRSARFNKLKNMYFAAAQRPTGIVSTLAALIALRRYIAEVKPDAVMTFQHYGNIIGAVVAKLAGVKLVVANLNSSRAQCPWWVPYADIVLGFCRVYNVVVSNSAKTSEEFHVLQSAMGERMIRIDHGVAPKLTALSKPEARKELGLPADVSLIGCAARLHYQKNQTAILAAMPFLPGIHLALAGDGDERANLEAQAKDLGISDRVTFVGELDSNQVATFLGAIDVFVFPSKAESFGLAVVEAAIVGLPVVCNDLPILREVLLYDSKACARFVDANDPVEFSSAIRELFSDRDAAAQLVASAKLLQERYSLDRMNDAYERMLRDAGCGQSAPLVQLAQVELRSHQ